MGYGPGAGERVPPFEAFDQDGRRQSFDTINGPNGAFIIFHRSADW